MKNLTRLIVTAILLATLTGCGNKDAVQTTADTTTTAELTTTTAETTTTVAETTTTTSETTTAHTTAETTTTAEIVTETTAVLTEAATTAAQNEEAYSTYIFRCRDTEGNPVSNVMIQVCTDELCLMAKSDETGDAVHTGEPFSYDIHIFRYPEEYELTSEQHFTTADEYSAYDIIFSKK